MFNFEPRNAERGVRVTDELVRNGAFERFNPKLCAPGEDRFDTDVLLDLVKAKRSLLREVTSTKPHSSNVPLEQRLDRIAERFAAKPTTSQLSFAMACPSTGFTWAYGDTDPYFIASVTKLYTAALIMQLRSENAFTGDTTAGELLGEDIMHDLNIFEGRDHSPDITVDDLLAHTSGIADYFEEPRADGDSLRERMLRTDLSWTFDNAIAAARARPGHFAPGTYGKACYSDTNYQFLGRIIEVLTGTDYEEALRRRILQPLGLSETYLFTQRGIRTHVGVDRWRPGRR
ncbi:MAG: serine hydrolase domain-containing protein [Beutenbergiaceae bacterium]